MKVTQTAQKTEATVTSEIRYHIRFVITQNQLSETLQLLFRRPFREILFEESDQEPKRVRLASVKIFFCIDKVNAMND